MPSEVRTSGQTASVGSGLGGPGGPDGPDKPDDPGDPIDARIRQLLDGGEVRPAVEMMMREYGNKVYSMAYRVLGNIASASDVLQQTFLEALRDVKSFRGHATVLTWLLGITWHRAIDLTRRARRERQRLRPEEEAQEIPEITALDMPAVLDRRRLHHALEECLLKVSATTRAALLMRYQHQLSYEVISRTCGEKPGTLQARVTRAMPVLRRCLAEKGMVP